MGKHELIEAFIRGDIDRRQFVSRLTMLGVSGGAALAYASRLTEGAAAAPAGSVNGFRMRQQADDEDYGTAIVIGVIEAIQTALSGIETLVLSLLESLDQFTPGDFLDGVYELLQTIFDQQQQHLDALQALLGATSGAAMGQSVSRAIQSTSIETPEDLLSTLSANLDDLTSMYAALVPAVQDGGVRQTMMEIASVASRHAAVAGTVAEEDPIPSAFQQPSIPTGL